MAIASAFHFVPSRNFSAKDNIEKFIRFARWELNCFPDADWDAISWDVSSYFSKRADPISKVRLSWRSMTVSGKKSAPPLLPLLGDFARAYVSYLHCQRPTTNPPRRRVDPFKAIDLAIRQLDLNQDEIWHVAIFNQAQKLIRDNQSAGYAYRTAKELEKVAAFLDENLMTPMRLSWKTTLARPCDLSWRVSKEAENARLSKMPSDRALKACAEAFLSANKPADVLIASTVPLLMCGPNRIGEVLTLPISAQCEQIFDSRVQFGLRWFPEKDGPKQVKWVLPSFSQTVKGAFSNILRITMEARRMAHWYELNPAMLYLPEGLEYLRRQSFLDAEELCTLIGLQGRFENSARQWCSRRGIRYSNRPFRVWFGDVESCLVSELPVGFPWRHRQTKLTYSESLYVVPKNFFHNGNRPISRVMFEPVTHANINTGLGGHEKNGKSSIFSRMGMVEDDGSPIQITTHAFRHWLNTLAQRGGLSQLDIALWSGRTSVAENRAYDHMTASELIEKAKAALPGFKPVGTLKAAIVSRDEISHVLSEHNAGAIHHTEIGICVHDYTMLPCQLHMDCVNCHENVCVKGDAQKTKRLADLQEKISKSLSASKADEERSYAGANRWRQHQEISLQRVTKLLQIMQDPNVPEGTLIQLSAANEWTPIKRSVSERIKLDPSLPKAIQGGAE